MARPLPPTARCPPGTEPAAPASIRHEGGHRGPRSRVWTTQGSDTDLIVLIADGGDNPPLGLRVSTTARTAAERTLVLRHVKRALRL